MTITFDANFSVRNRYHLRVIFTLVKLLIISVSVFILTGQFALSQEQVDTIPAVNKATGDLILDFGSLQSDSVTLTFAEKGQKAEIREIVGRQAMRFEWDAATAQWCSARLKNAVPVPSAGKMSFSLEILQELDSSLRRVSLFLVDSDNETFQLVMDLPEATGNWQTVSYEFDTENLTANITGGRTPNKIVDPPLRLQSVSCSQRSKEGLESIALGKLAVWLESAPIQATLETGDNLRVVVPGRENDLKLRFHNPGRQSQVAQVEYQLLDPDDNELLHEKKQLNLDGSAIVEIPLPAPKHFGVYMLRYLVGDGDLSAQPAQRFAYMTPAGIQPGSIQGFIFGVCTHIQRYSPEERQLMARALGLCGAKLARAALESHRILPREGEWNFAICDDIFRLLKEQHVEYAPIFLGLPAWADAADWTPAIENNSPRGHRPDYQHWTDYVCGFAERYAADLRYAEIWNEPDLIGFANFSPEEYLELLKIASPLLRKTVPGITLISAGFASPDLNPPGRTADPNYVRKCVVTGSDYWDLFAVHMHSSPVRYRDHSLPGLMRFRQEIGDNTPWYANETAYPSVGGISERYQAETLFINLFRSWQNGAVGYNWYNLRNIRNDPKDPEANYGMLTYDLQPKPVYVTYNTITRFFRAAKTLPQGEYETVYQAADGAYLIPYWREPEEQGTSLLLFSGVQGQATRIDLWGNETLLQTKNNVLMIDNAISPAILRITGQDVKEAPQPGGKFLEYDNNLALIPGRRQSVAYTCRNPSDQPLDVKIEFASVPGLNIEPATKQFTIPPQGEALSEFAFLLTGDYRATPLPLTLTIGDIWSGTLTLLLESIISIPGGDFSREPELRLERLEQISSFVSVEPAYAHLQWRGAEDLSAQVYLAQVTDTLRVQIAVTDDKHYQPHQGIDVWQGDNVQLGLSIPGQQGYWEFGFTHFTDSAAEVYTWIHPSGYKPDQVTPQISLTTSRDNAVGKTCYNVEIPFSAVGLTKKIAQEGFRLNVLVNDNDGEGRENAIAAAPGMLEKDPTRFPRFQSLSE